MEDMKQLSFKIVDYKVDHYSGRDLIVLKINIENNEYNLSFLVDDYNVILFPDFKVLDKYGKIHLKIIQEFLISIRTKVNYFIKLRSYKLSKNKKTNDWDPAIEWWQKEKVSDEVGTDLKKWIDKNVDYLMDFSFEELKDENLLNDFINFFEGRKNSKKPIFEFETDYQNETKILKKQLDKAISEENFELAVIIREKLKNTTNA